MDRIRNFVDWVRQSPARSVVAGVAAVGAVLGGAAFAIALSNAGLRQTADAGGSQSPSRDGRAAQPIGGSVIHPDAIGIANAYTNADTDALVIAARDPDANVDPGVGTRRDPGPHL